MPETPVTQEDIIEVTSQQGTSWRLPQGVFVVDHW